MPAQLRRILRATAALVGFAVYVWITAVRNAGRVKRRKRRKRRV